MNKRLIQTVMILLLISQVLLNFVPSYVVQGAWVIEGDTVYVDNAQVYLAVTPHTIIESDTVIFHLRSKQYSGNIDAVWLFNVSNCRPKKPVYFKVGTGDWNLLNKTIDLENINYQNYTKAYSLKEINVNQGVDYYLKVPMEITFNTSGKYWFGIKKTGDPWNQGLWLDPWWHSDWQNFRTLTISNTYIDNDLVNFTTLVTINSTIAGNCRTHGEDIRFLATDNTTEYDYEIEFWNASGDSFTWVRIPRVESGTDTVFLMYYNNSVASDNQNPSGTWDSNHVGVWHLNESGSTYTDSTSYFNNGTGTSMNNNVSGKIASCVSINSGVTTARVTVPDDTELKITGAITLSAWVVQGSGVANFHIISKDPTKEFELYHTNALNRWRWYRGGNVKENNFGWVEQRDTWYYVTVADDGTNSRVYINGAQIGSTDTALVGVSSTTDVNLLNRPGSSLSYESSMDEARISNVARNGSWIKANYNSMHTSGFLTWGAEQLNIENPVTNFTASTLGYTEINLTWTTGLNSTHTYIMRKTGSSPSSRTDGTNIYNGTGETFSDSSLSEWIVYYYSAWGFNSTTSNWTTPVGATNHTGCLNPTGVTAITRTGYLNVTWTLGTRADNTLLVHNVTTYPTSVTDGTLLYNGTNTYYNDTVYYSGRYTLFSWNSSTDLYSSGYQVQYGSLTISVYDESNGTAIANWDCFVTNQNGSETYENLGNTNPLVIDINDLPLGNNVAIKLNATDYNFSLFYMDLVANNIYTLNAHLTHRDVSILCLLTVWDEIDLPIEDATMEIERYINASVGFEYVGIYITDANGQVTTYLTPNELYKFTITKTDYETEIADWTPDVELREKTFRLSSIDTEWEYFLFWDYIEFTGSMNDDGNITISYSDSSGLTTNTTIYLYDSYNGTDTLLHTATNSSNSFSYTVNLCNNSRLHYAWLYFTHSYSFSITQPVTVYIQPTNTTNASWTPHTVTDLEGAFTSVLGNNPLGWGNSIAFAVAFIFLCSFAPYDVGAAIIGAGLSLLGVKSAFVLNPVLLITVPIIIAIGIFYVIAKRQAEEMV